MARSSIRFYGCKNCVTVAVGAKLHNVQKMAGRFAFCPQSVAGTAEKSKFSGFKSFFKGLAVCVAHHQNLAASLILRNNRNHSACFLPVKAARKSVFKADFICIERHSKLNVAMHFLKSFNFVFRRNAARDNDTATYGSAKLLRHLKIRSLHAAFFFHAGKKKLGAIFLCKFRAFNKRNINRFRPAFYSDFSVQSVHTDNNALLSDRRNKLVQEFCVQDIGIVFRTFFPRA